MEITPLTIFVIIAIIAVIYVLKGFKIIPQSETRVVERLGRYDRTLNSGINYLLPIIDRAFWQNFLKKICCRRFG